MLPCTHQWPGAARLTSSIAQQANLRLFMDMFVQTYSPVSLLCAHSSVPLGQHKDSAGHAPFHKHVLHICHACYHLHILCCLLQTVKLSSADKLIRYVENSQLTSDLGGFLPYNHEHWLKLRLVCVCVCGRVCGCCATC